MADLRDLLYIRGLPTTGTKADLITRLNKSQLICQRKSVVPRNGEKRICTAPKFVATGDNDGDIRGTSITSTPAKNKVASLLRELELLRRENALMQRELELTKREFALERNRQSLTATAADSNNVGDSRCKENKSLQM